VRAKSKLKEAGGEEEESKQDASKKAKPEA